MTRPFASWSVGENWTTPAAVISEKKVHEFADITGDHNPLHTDTEAAKRGIFGRPVAHGMLVASTVVGLWMRHEEFLGVGFAGIDSLRWLRPVDFGASIHAQLTITKVEDRGSYGLVVLQNEVRDAAGDTVLVFDARLAVQK